MIKLIKNSFYIDYMNRSNKGKLAVEVELDTPDSMTQKTMHACVDRFVADLLKQITSDGIEHPPGVKESDKEKSKAQDDLVPVTADFNEPPKQPEELPPLTASYVLQAAKNFINAVPSGSSERKVTVKTMLKNDFGVDKLKDLPDIKYRSFIEALKAAQKD